METLSSSAVPMQTEPTSANEAALLMAAMIQDLINQGAQVPPEVLEQYQQLAGVPFQPTVPMQVETQQPQDPLQNTRKRKGRAVVAPPPGENEDENDVPLAEQAIEARRAAQTKAIQAQQIEASSALEIYQGQKEEFLERKRILEAITHSYVPIYSIDLVESNRRYNEDKEAKLHDLESNMALWTEIGKDYRSFGMDLKGRLSYELQLTNWMNKWVAMLTYSGREQEVAIKIPEKQKWLENYSLFRKPKRDFLSMCEKFKVPTYSKEDLYKVVNYLLPAEGEAPSKALQPHFGVYGLDPQTKLPRKFTISLVERSLGDIWETHELRAKRHSLIFNPTPSYFASAPSPDFYLNQWQGFRWTRDQVKDYTNWDLLTPFMNHIRLTWCYKEEEFKHIIAHWAFMFQKPWMKDELCEVIGGTEGTIKSWVYDAIGFIVGKHYAHLQNPEDLVGEFTAARENMILIFADEAQLVGKDKGNALKNLVTCTNERVRHMHHDPTNQDSFAIITVASNLEHFIEASEKARRFLCLISCLDALYENEWYQANFGAERLQYPEMLHGTMYGNDHAGLKTLLNLLYNLPLGSYDPRKVPVTMMLAQQKIGSLPIIKKWWLDCLIRGYHQEVKTLDGEPAVEWREQPNRELLYEEFKAFLHRTDRKGYSKDCNTMAQWIVRMEELLPRREGIPFQITQTILSSQIKNGKETEAYVSKNMLNIPPLEQCREYFNTIVPGAEFSWAESQNIVDLMKQRVKKMSPEEIFNWIPDDFYGYPLRKRLSDNTFEVIGDDKWRPIDDKVGFITKSSPEVATKRAELLKNFNEVNQRYLERLKKAEDSNTP